MLKKTDIVMIKKNPNHILKSIILLIVSILVGMIFLVNFYDVTIFFNNIDYLIKNFDLDKLFIDYNYMTGKPDTNFNTDAGPSSHIPNSSEIGSSKTLDSQDKDISKPLDISQDEISTSNTSKKKWYQEYYVDPVMEFRKLIFWTDEQLNPPPSKPLNELRPETFMDIDPKSLNRNENINSMDTDIESLDKGKRKATTLSTESDVENQKSSSKIRKTETQWNNEAKNLSSEFKKGESNWSPEYKQWREDMFKKIDGLELKKEEDKANKFFKSLIDVLEKDEYRDTYEKFQESWRNVHQARVEAQVDHSKDHRWGPLFPLEGEPELKYSREEYKFALGYVNGNYNQAELDAIIEAKYRFEEIKQIAPYIKQESMKIEQERFYLPYEQYVKRYNDLYSLRVRQWENQMKDQEFRTMLSKTTRYHIDQMYWSKHWPPEKPK